MDLQQAMATISQRIERLKITLQVLESELTPTQITGEERRAVLSLPPIPEIIYKQPPKKQKAFRRKTGGRPNRELILEYVHNHPNCKREEVAKALGINSTAASFHMSGLKKAGQITAVRKNGQWFWNANKPSSAAPKPEVFDDERPEPIVNYKDGLDKPGRHVCVICDKAFSFPGGLTEHMRNRHPGGK